jgi:hypothetical protein
LERLKGFYIGGTAGMAAGSDSFKNFENDPSGSIKKLSLLKLK